MTKYILLLVGACWIFSSAPSQAVIEQVEFDEPQQEQRYRDLTEELRCVVCQNQNIADSEAPLAKDLREITADMIRQGASDDEVKTFMRDRYGDFVLYRTPFNSATAFLWLGPIIVLLIVLFGVIKHIRKRQEDDLLGASQSQDDTNRIKVRNLLRDTPNLGD
ncbi:cytochrome c-type biogenesis protein [Arenicella xantha]|uniref:Cytochrome c-type biogenesis protein n=1 Tax=Arenicella xantha TaxID=644221 RepID=A0A395JFS2_9GAMM|nr:cytochrome c-type biogenesis protein [Arenicella xantha]RBP48610.1 cytochrome c-type biogenesis protein CcmH [Arenicella xantha]